MSDQAFRDETLTRLARLETQLENIDDKQSSIDLKLDTLRITIVESQGRSIGRSMLARTAGHLITGAVATIAATIAAANGVFHFGK